MDLVSIALGVVAVAFASCVVAIAIWDVKTYTIPNFISVALLWLFLVGVSLSRVDVSLTAHIYSFLVVLGVGLVAFRFGILGGGDVKSWAAVAIWYDIGALPIQVVMVTLIGSCLGLAILVLRRLAESHVGRLRAGYLTVPRMLRTGEPVPYGLAISLGTALTAGQIEIFGSLSF